METGIVEQVNNADVGLGGRTVWVRSGRGRAYYAHNQTNLVRTGQPVAAGQVIARVGSTGNASANAPHLHFGYKPTGQSWVNPYPMLRQACGRR
jgi:peptidoglycan LD-endopeptidase LytH